jgi:creatinine amidohydrolase
MSDPLLLAEMTSARARALAAEGRTVAIPIGALEAHGPHLPLAADTMQAEAVVREVSRRTGVLVAPPIAYGVCLSTRDHPGTVGITTETLKGLVTDILTSLARSGFSSFLLVSGHAGKTHVHAIRDACEILLDRHPGWTIALVSEYDALRGWAADLIRTAEDGHAGEIETSRILALRPDLVQGSAPEEYPDFDPFILSPRKTDLWPGSVWGDPGAASAGKGELLLERSVEHLCRVVLRLTSERCASGGRGEA